MKTDAETADRWDFEPEPDETFEFDPAEDRKWDVFLIDEDDIDQWPEGIVISH